MKKLRAFSPGAIGTSFAFARGKGKFLEYSETAPSDLVSLEWAQSVLRSCAAVVVWREEYNFLSKGMCSLEYIG